MMEKLSELMKRSL